MRALLLLMLSLVAAPALAQDAPLLLPATPTGYVLATEVDQVAVARYIVKLETENVELKSAVKAQLHPAVIVGLVVLGVAVGGAAGFGIARAVK